MSDKSLFQLATPYKPAGDQPQAILGLVQGLEKGFTKQTLLGVTGSGKTFTAANVIAQYNKPTLVIAHNKTLAAQLAQEYREFFPHNAVHYFVSYYDYYQPEAYIPSSDTYIEKEAMINEEIERLRHASTQALLTRKDVIIVASVSCIYGLGSPEEYEKVNLKLKVGMELSRAELIRKLIDVHFERTMADLKSGQFRATGNMLEVMPVNEKTIYRIEFGEIRDTHINFFIPAQAGIQEQVLGKQNKHKQSKSVVTERSDSSTDSAILDPDLRRDDTRGSNGITHITELDPVSRSVRASHEAIFIFPAKHFISSDEQSAKAYKTIQAELVDRLKVLEKGGKMLEAERLKRRVKYDLSMIKEIGYTNGIENYSRHFSGHMPGEAPDTLLAYFPKRPATAAEKKAGASDMVPNFLTVIDESHVTIPQLNGMYAGDASRKDTLVEHGFRLPSAKDNRPLKFPEFLERVGPMIYTSATPGKYEVAESQHTVEQVIRPTGLIDPIVDIKPIREGKIKNPPALPPPFAKGEKGMMSSDNSSFEKGGARRAEDFYSGQIFDFIEEAEKTIKQGFRAIATTLTKKMAEDLSEFLKEKKIKAAYLHSDIKTIDRINILTNFRRGKYDILVGVNLLREGLDLPEVALIGILDADKEGFLRSETSLIQTIGRAARNSAGRVILYADNMTDSMTRAIRETDRRRAIQVAYNTQHGITPTTIIKAIHDITDQLRSEHDKAVGALVLIDEELARTDPKKLYQMKEEAMAEAVQALDFETAALIRDELFKLEEKMGVPGRKGKKINKRK
jgi:excinuclease ABC subunit B